MADDQLRLKISLGGFEVELYGDSQIVIQQFEEIKKNGLGQLTGAISSQSTSNHGESTTGFPIPDEPVIPSEVPHESLHNLALKKMANSETEWVLIFAYYASDFGKKKFTRNDILSKYDESNRISLSHRSNLSNNIKTLTRNNMLAAYNTTTFIITNSGIEMVRRILARKAK